MQLTIDLTPMLLRSAGVKNHVFYWAQALERFRKQRQLRFYPFVPQLPPLHHDQGLESGIPNWRLFLIAAMNIAPLHGLAQFAVPRLDVFHGSPQARLPPRTRRLTSHIHDLTCWIMPELHTEANARAMRQMAGHCWRRADGLIAVSESAKQDAVRLVGLDPERITVIHHGVPEEYFAVRAEERARVRAKLGLRRNYVLCVGTVEPRKNLDRLLDAWALLPVDVQGEFEFVIAGPAGWKADATLARLRQKSESVRYLGYVAESDLPGLTAGATALAYPSLYEGFGFPLAQAMACGVPAVTSNVSSMPEVAAGSALLIDPRSVEELRAALLRLLTSGELRRALGSRGRAHAEENYRWDRVALQSWDFFDRIAG
jgi:glycosyltransferase involved in cell wall biosynthesis